MASLSDFPAARVTRWLAALAGGLLALHLLLQIVEHFGGGVHYLILDRFNVDVEDSFPTWYSSATLLACAGLLAAIARRRRGDPFARHWWVLSLTFVALSIDETVGLHETLNTVSSIGWTGPAAIAVALFGIGFLRFLRHLPQSARRGFIIAGLCYVGGAIGIEQALGWLGGKTHLESFAYALWSAAEEGAEMAGVLIFLYSLLRLLEDDPATSPR